MRRRPRRAGSSRRRDGSSRPRRGCVATTGQTVGERLDQLQRRATALAQRHDRAARFGIGAGEVLDETARLTRGSLGAVLEAAAGEHEARVGQLQPDAREDLLEQEAQAVRFGA